MFSQSVAATLALGLLSSANAHLFMNSPTPFEGFASKSPLEADGSNFPCQGASLAGTYSRQGMAVGSSQKLSFELGSGANWAVHGGGSCQLSVTYETDATKIKDPSNWKVIYSIIGGCPSNTLLNLDGPGAWPCGSSQAPNSVDCVNSFNFTMPQGMKNGDATIAWTWFNAVGNREMYMNCAPISITGGSSDTSVVDSLPDLFVANVAAGTGSTCATIPYTNVEFPDPGDNVLTKTAEGAAAASQTTSYKAAAPTGAGCAAAAAAPTSNAQKPSTTAAQATSAAGSGYIGSSAKASATGNAGGIFAPGASSVAQATSAPKATASAAAGAGGAATSFLTVVATKTAATSAVVATSAAAAATGSTGSSNSSSGTCTGDAVACTNEGGVVCIDDKWGLCDHGCAVPQLMAAGMTCDAGVMKASARMVRRNHIHGNAHRRSLNF